MHALNFEFGLPSQLLRRYTAATHARLWYSLLSGQGRRVQLQHWVAELFRLSAPLQPCSYLEMKERDAQLKQSEAPSSSKDQGTQTEGEAAV